MRGGSGHLPKDAEQPFMGARPQDTTTSNVRTLLEHGHTEHWAMLKVGEKAHHDDHGSSSFLSPSGNSFCNALPAEVFLAQNHELHQRFRVHLKVGTEKFGPDFSLQVVALGVLAQLVRAHNYHKAPYPH